MTDSSHIVEVERMNGKIVARLQESALEFPRVRKLANVLIEEIEGNAASNLVLHFPDKECLYSALISQLLRLRRHMKDAGGQLLLSNVPPLTRDVIRVANLDDMFEFLPGNEKKEHPEDSTEQLSSE